MQAPSDQVDGDVGNVDTDLPAVEGLGSGDSHAASAEWIEHFLYGYRVLWIRGSPTRPKPWTPQPLILEGRSLDEVVWLDQSLLQAIWILVRKALPIKSRVCWVDN